MRIINCIRFGNIGTVTHCGIIISKCGYSYLIYCIRLIDNNTARLMLLFVIIVDTDLVCQTILFTFIGGQRTMTEKTCHRSQPLLT
jgi:hypothetical protein